MNLRAVRGARSETIACRWLERRGLTTVYRNFRCRFGELDLVMLDCDELVVVEVRSRSSGRFVDPATSIDRRKQARIAFSAELFRQRFPRYADNAVRFDVVALTGDDKPAVEWIRDAFTMD